jgi:hypothetical protein
VEIRVDRCVVPHLSIGPIDSIGALFVVPHLSIG